jgi:hypothetical protein
MSPKTQFLFEANAIRLDNVTGTQIAASTSGENVCLTEVEWEAIGTNRVTFMVGHKKKG